MLTVSSTIIGSHSLDDFTVPLPSAAAFGITHTINCAHTQLCMHVHTHMPVTHMHACLCATYHVCMHAKDVTQQ